MSKRHARQHFFILAEGVYGPDLHKSDVRSATAAEQQNMYRFSRIGPPGEALPEDLLVQVAEAMTRDLPLDGSSTPAGFTYLGQFVDHDLTLDKTALSLGAEVSVNDLVQGRSPALDLDSLYGLGPALQPQFYAADGLHLKLGDTLGTDFPVADQTGLQSVRGHDLPRGTDNGARLANIPDPRNDENLAVAQIHVAFARFHNHVVDRCIAAGVKGGIFAQARGEVVKHYQSMLRDDYLPRICRPEIVREVFSRGRRLFEPNGSAAEASSMPIEFSVGAFRLGHSMVRRSYQWNRIFQAAGPGPAASLELLFAFSGTSGDLTPPGLDPFAALPSTWMPDWHRLFDFRDALDTPFPGNRAEKINTLLTPMLATLPPGSFGGIQSGAVSARLQQQLAFRNLMRATMVRLASGQQIVDLLRSADLLASGDVLEARQILNNAGQGADLDALSPDQKLRITQNTPLWFYTLREAEVLESGERLGPLGSRIVVETFHHAMECSQVSILRETGWKPSLGRGGKFAMRDLLAVAFPEGLNRLE